MNINTNGWTIYAPEGTTLEELIEAFEVDEDLWSKATEHKIHPSRGQAPRAWVLSHGVKDIVFTTGRDKNKMKAWRQQTVKCECGRSVTQGELCKHRKTAVHLRCLAEQTDAESQTTGSQNNV